MAQEADLKSVGLIAYGFESRLRYHFVVNYLEKENFMLPRQTSYSIFGYDKDSDVYELLMIMYADLAAATSVANYLATLSLRRKDNNEPFDWIEVCNGHGTALYYALQ